VCDTFVVLAERTASGLPIFAKNSDREPTEAQALEWHAAAEHPPGARLRTTHIEIPQARRTHALLISRPYWMWGAEMGVNEAGVAIGNEAVFTRAKLDEVALLGMDLLRLALERAGSAREALDVMTAAIAEHGQGGEAGHVKSFRYSSSFIIADPEQAFVLETAGRAWVAARARAVRSISNGLTIRDDWELASDGLSARARDAGLSPNRGKLDFAKTFGEPVFTWAAAATRRRGCTEAFLARFAPVIEPSHAMSALRQHGPGDRYRPGAWFMTVCGHASWMPTRSSSQTTGSLVVELGRDRPTVYATGTAAPCTSTFKPLWVDRPVAGLGPAPTRRFHPESAWWAHEKLHRAALADLDRFRREFAPVRDRLEASWRAELGGDRAALSARALREGRELDLRWLERLGPPRALPGLGYRRYWRKWDRDSGLASAVDC
jgi:dipeptidase